jgi:arsenate reductase
MSRSLTIYHNPACSKSRKTLELIREHGVEPRIVEYLKSPPSATTTLRIAGMLGVAVVDLVRTSQSDEDEETLALNDHALAHWLEQNPSALQRPIVVDETSDRACIGRPPENVLKLLKS